MPIRPKQPSESGLSGYASISTLSSAHPLTVKAGDRVAQLVLERIATPDVVEVASLDDSQRGAGGFGSTGVSNKV